MLKTQVVVVLIAVAALLGLAAGGGGAWMVKGWKDSGEISKLQGAVSTQEQTIATLKGANASCVAGVGDVKAAVKTFIDEGKQASASAAAAMQKAAKQSAQNLADAKEAMKRPPAPPGQECPTMIREALDYAKRRKAGQ